jgi:hypothetical protein
MSLANLLRMTAPMKSGLSGGAARRSEGSVGQRCQILRNNDGIFDVNQIYVDLWLRSLST